jgi:hypothetical protein
MEEYGIWSDEQMYQAVRSGSKQYQWHKKAKWWNSMTLSPSTSSYHRRENQERNLLSGFEVVVAKMVATEEAKQIVTDSVLLSLFVREGVSLFQGPHSVYKSLSGDQVRFGGMYSIFKILSLTRFVLNVQRLSFSVNLLVQTFCHPFPPIILLEVMPHMLC